MPGYGGVKTTTASARTLRSVTGGNIKHFGKARVTAVAKSAAGANVLTKTDYEVASVGRPVWSVSAANDSAKTVWVAPGGAGVAPADNVKQL